jgi:hypothetical protein
MRFQKGNIPRNKKYFSEEARIAAKTDYNARYAKTHRMAHNAKARRYSKSHSYYRWRNEYKNSASVRLRDAKKAMARQSPKLSYAGIPTRLASLWVRWQNLKKQFRKTIK